MKEAEIFVGLGNDPDLEIGIKPMITIATTIQFKTNVLLKLSVLCSLKNYKERGGFEIVIYSS